MKPEYQSIDLHRHYRDGWREGAATGFVAGATIGVFGVLAGIWMVQQFWR
jgi:hypothetical protein